MVKIPDEAPKDLAGWNELVELSVQDSKEKYDEAVAKAKADATASWDKEYPDKLSKLLAQAEANINAEVVDGPEGPVSLTGEQKQAKLAEARKEIDAELEKQKKEHIENAVSFIDQPHDKQHFERMYSFLKPQENTEPEPEPTPTVDVYDATWKVGERYWNVAEAKYVAADLVDQTKVINLAGPDTTENIRQNIKLYSRYDNRIQLGPEVMDTEELFVRLRERRAVRLAEYDDKIAQYDRQIRLNPERAEYVLKRSQWDDYAVSLCNLPAQSGAPWDGGGADTPWPTKPE